MRHGFLVLLALLTTCVTVAQDRTIGNCRQTPSLCEIEIGGQTLTFGMPKNRALEILSRTPYQVVEDSTWTTEHKPDSRFHITVKKGQPFGGVMKGGVKFKGERLDGAMVDWSPDSNEQSDFAASIINLLERFSSEGSTSCTLTTSKTPRPQQEDREVMFQCGLRAVGISHIRFQSSYQGQKVGDYAGIFEMLGNW